MRRIDEDPVTMARQLAFRVGALTESLLSHWEFAPGLPDLQRSVQAIRLPWEEMDSGFDEASDIHDVAACLPLVDALAVAVRNAFADEDLGEREVTRGYLRDILAACYVLEQFVGEVVSISRDVAPRP